MAEAVRRWEAERAAWIREQTWRDEPSAARRAAQLAKRARRLDRDGTGRGGSTRTEADLPSLFKRWTKHEDSWTSALGTTAFVVLFWLIIPIWFGVAWAVGTVSLWAWEQAADKHRVRVGAYFVAAAVAAVALVAIRHLGGDLWAITLVAGFLETATDGLIAPAVLSMWYAGGVFGIGIVGWIEAQIVLGLVYGGLLAHAWGWAAPAIRNDVRARSSKRTNGKQDKRVRIISDRRAASEPTLTTEARSEPVERPATAPIEQTTTADERPTTLPDPLKIISARRHGGEK